jgi:ubiquinone biosynthesis protein COQ4
MHDTCPQGRAGTSGLSLAIYQTVRYRLILNLQYDRALARRSQGEAPMTDVPYLLRGVMPVATESSMLVSSSKYLNHPRLREWVAMILLRKNGPDFPAQAEMHDIIGIMDELRDHDRIEWLFTEERKTNKQMDDWFKEDFISDYKLSDFKDYASDTVGGKFYRYLFDGGFEAQIVPWRKPETQLQFYNLRSGQTHDFEHILCGGGFNYLGELIPYWYRLTNTFKFIQNKELAGEMCVMSILGSLRYTVRTMLHYPEVWETAVGCIQRGMKVGQESDALFMKKIEPVFGMKLDEARKALGVRGVVDIDTNREGDIWFGKAA